MTHLGGSKPPTLPLFASYYHTQFRQRRKEYIVGSKPLLLKHLGRIDQKAFRQYQNHLDRTSPLARSEFYARQMESRGVRSAWLQEKLLGKPFGRVWRALKVFDLPLR